MAESIGYMLAQTFQLSASQTAKTTDDRGGPTARTVAAGWYRSRLCPAAGAGTETDPAEFLNAVEAALGSSKWVVQQVASGFVEVGYVGTGTGTIDWSTGNLGLLLGFSASSIGPLSPGSAATGTYLPSHCVLAIACDPDTGWVDGPGRFAGAALPDGTVYGWHDGRATMRRSATFRLLPRDWTVRATLSAQGTPAYPVNTRWLSPSTSEPYQALPWSALDTLATAASRQCGVTWGDFEAIIAGTVTSYDVVYLAPETFTAGTRLSLSVAGYDGRRDVAFDALFYGAGAL